MDENDSVKLTKGQLYESRDKIEFEEVRIQEHECIK